MEDINRVISTASSDVYFHGNIVVAELHRAPVAESISLSRGIEAVQENLPKIGNIFWMSDFAPILIPTSESVRVTWGDQEAEIEAIEFVKWQIEKADAALLAFFASKLELGYELLEPCFDLDDEDQQTEFAAAVESLTVISYSADEEAFSMACKTMERLKRLDSERILPLIAERMLDSSDGLQAYLETRLDHADPWAGLGLYDGFEAPIVVLSEGQFMPYVEPCGDRVMMDSWNVSDIWVRNNDEGDILFNVAS